MRTPLPLRQAWLQIQDQRNTDSDEFVRLYRQIVRTVRENLAAEARVAP